MTTHEEEIEDLQDQIASLQDEIGSLEWILNNLETEGGYSFNLTAKEIWQTCEEKGFHEPVDTKVLNRALRLILIIGEVTEALEAIRKGDDEHHREEIADMMIRLLHYGYCEGIDIGCRSGTQDGDQQGSSVQARKEFLSDPYFFSSCVE